MPDGAVYVGRPTKWGNPFKQTDYDEAGRAWAVERFEEVCGSERERAMAVRELRGKDLACWWGSTRPG